MAAPDYKIQPLVAGVAPSKLDRTPEGFRIFSTIFLSSMSQELRQFLQTLPQGQLKPKNDEERIAFDTIYHGLIQDDESVLGRRGGHRQPCMRA